MVSLFCISVTTSFADGMDYGIPDCKKDKGIVINLFDDVVSKDIVVTEDH